ncbi:hypothetical protein SODALDRAFT_320862 [Sodiomyces alkalinus F11]|uniref:Flavin reductase like domain-containing protein n=1 Tax=Sodiomyces alkalinus (strain CBS 110278 / VKM F-3762 / F11) TaxID=1314773 RepID=A0A3N2PM03_SODAK|nr:hypothetical protein SODALDRAFT_320862 [Sodiomyces alkalinus F11]ROT35555.1 hypothetical protein SODALDRAFT_320862 [Sodiomyces alkalinus F11]
MWLRESLSARCMATGEVVRTVKVDPSIWSDKYGSEVRCDEQLSSAAYGSRVHEHHVIQNRVAISATPCIHAFIGQATSRRGDGRRHLSTSTHRFSSDWHSTPPERPSVHPTSSHDSTTREPISEKFRSLMRLVTHSVVVCTSTEPAGPGTEGNPRGMTMSSFTSLSLQPTPLVTFNIATPSRTLSAVQKSRHFNVHILEDGVEGAKVADWFTRGNAEGQHVFQGLVAGAGSRIIGDEEGSPGCEAEMGANEAPILRGEGILYIIRCKVIDDAPLHGLIPVKDHVIVVGEVMEILEGRDRREWREDDFGLLYADRKYRQLGNVMSKQERG